MADAQTLFDKIDRLSPAAKLRLAAELLDRDRADIAMEVARLAVEELTMWKLRRAARGGRP